MQTFFLSSLLDVFSNMAATADKNLLSFCDFSHHFTSSSHDSRRDAETVEMARNLRKLGSGRWSEIGTENRERREMRKSGNTRHSRPNIYFNDDDNYEGEDDDDGPCEKAFDDYLPCKHQVLK